MMQHERHLLSIDLSYQVYRACAAHPQLTSRRVFTGGLYGFFMTFAKLARETRATHVAFCMDAKPYLRSLDYPEYKMSRRKTADEELKQRAQDSLVMVRDALQQCGLKCWAMPGFEADDLSAHLVRNYGGRFERMTVASNDSDLYQLLGEPGVALYARDRLITIEELRGQGLTPEAYMLMTALMGTHNGVQGIPRVGEATALRAVRDDPGLLRRLQADHGEIIQRNLDLIRLPHPKFPRDARMPIHSQTFDPRTLYRILGQYDIAVTGGMMSAFEQIKTGDGTRC